MSISAYEVTLSAVCEGRVAVAVADHDEDGDPVVRVLFSGTMTDSQSSRLRALGSWGRAVTIAKFAVLRMDLIRQRDAS